LNQKSKKSPDGHQISDDAFWVQVLLSQGQEKTLNVEFANLPDPLNLFSPQMIQESSQPVAIRLDRVLRKTLFNDQVMEKLIQVLIHDDSPIMKGERMESQ
jgi:hypothetical protein